MTCEACFVHYSAMYTKMCSCSQTDIVIISPQLLTVHVEVLLVQIQPASQIIQKLASRQVAAQISWR